MAKAKKSDGTATALGLAVLGLLAGVGGKLLYDHLQRRAPEDPEAAEGRRRAEELARAQAYVMQAVTDVAVLLGIPAPLVFFSGCANAETDGTYICFSSEWAVTEMRAGCANDVCAWSRVLAVVCHEFGHIIDPLWGSGHPWQDEQRADWHAGRLLGLLGISPKDFVDLLATWPASPTHPAGIDRISWVCRGFEAATGVRFYEVAA